MVVLPVCAARRNKGKKWARCQPSESFETKAPGEKQKVVYVWTELVMVDTGADCSLIYWDPEQFPVPVSYTDGDFQQRRVSLLLGVRQYTFQVLPQGSLHSPTLCHGLVAQGLATWTKTQTEHLFHSIDDVMLTSVSPADSKTATKSPRCSYGIGIGHGAPMPKGSDCLSTSWELPSWVRQKLCQYTDGSLNHPFAPAVSSGTREGLWLWFMLDAWNLESALGFPVSALERSRSAPLAHWEHLHSLSVL